MAQVETSFLLQPMKKLDGGSDEDKKLKGRISSAEANIRRRYRNMEMSSSEESEEDFAFLDQDLQD